MAQTSTVQSLDRKTSKLALFRERNFVLLWLAGLFSSLGFYGFMFTEAWYVVRVLNLEASLGMVYISSSIPRVIFMTIGGAAADRISRSKILFISDLSRASLLVILIGFLAFDFVSIWTFAGLALFFGILDSFFWPAQNSLIPNVAPKEQITRANSVIQTTNQSAIIVAPMICGLVIASGNYIMTFAMMSCFLIISSVLVFFIKIAQTNDQSSNEASSSFMKSVTEGLSYVKQIPWLKTIMVISGLLNFLLVGPMTMGLPLFVDNIIKGNTLDYSFLEGALAFGALSGAILIGVFNISKKRGMLSMAIIGISSVFLIVFSFSTMLWQASVMIFMFGVALSSSNIIAMSLLQETISEKFLGRVMGLLSTASMGLIPVSYGITSLMLAAGLGIDTIMTAGAISILIVTVFILIKVTSLREIN